MSAPPGELVVVPATAAPLDAAPGERYYRHPGDLVRLLVWTVTLVAILLFVAVATGTSEGVRTDLGDLAGQLPTAARQLLLGTAQLAAVAAPAALAVVLVARRRWRRLATVSAAAALGAGVSALVTALLADPPAVSGRLDADGWLLPSRFPTAAYVAGAFAVLSVSKPWLSRRWRHAADLAGLSLAAATVAAGTIGGPEAVLAVAAGGVAGAVVLVTVGAPNRRPSPGSIAAALDAAGFAVGDVEVVRAAGGRAMLVRATAAGGPLFLKVYGEDSRDADFLYRSYRTLVLREGGGRRSARPLEQVEHQALLLVLCARAGVTCPEVRGVVGLADGSAALVCDDVDGRPLDEVLAGLAPSEPGVGRRREELLDGAWRRLAAMHDAGLAHGAARAGNLLVERGESPAIVVVDLSAGSTAADARTKAIDRAELLCSLAAVVGAEAATHSAARVLTPADLDAAAPYLQPLALSAATRARMSKTTLRALREGIAAITGHEPEPLERLVRVRPRTVVMMATSAGAFYILLPQLARVDDSVDALGSANWYWLLGAAAMSLTTYVASAVGTVGSVPRPIPFAPTVEMSVASSFVNRVTPANVGGMALNVRYLQKAGVPPAEAVTGVGLNVVAGGIVHIGLLALFLTWAGRSGSGGFSVPKSSVLLVVIVVVLALLGGVMATRWGRGLLRAHVLPPVRTSLRSISSLSRSPGRLAALFGGSVGVTMAYIVALACAVTAFDGQLSFADVGAVYLGSSLVAAAAPTPGGLGALEAALVAGLTGVGMDPALAVAAVLSYRLVTYWLPIIPGWLCFRWLERRNYI